MDVFGLFISSWTTKQNSTTNKTSFEGGGVAELVAGLPRDPKVQGFESPGSQIFGSEKSL
jgi:hypothetical protein